MNPLPLTAGVTHPVTVMDLPSFTVTFVFDSVSFVCATRVPAPTSTLRQTALITFMAPTSATGCAKSVPELISLRPSTGAQKWLSGGKPPDTVARLSADSTGRGATEVDPHGAIQMPAHRSPGRRLA